MARKKIIHSVSPIYAGSSSVDSLKEEVVPSPYPPEIMEQKPIGVVRTVDVLQAGNYYNMCITRAGEPQICSEMRLTQITPRTLCFTAADDTVLTIYRGPDEIVRELGF